MPHGVPIVNNSLIAREQSVARKRVGEVGWPNATRLCRPVTYQRLIRRVLLHSSSTRTVRCPKAARSINAPRAFYPLVHGGSVAQSRRMPARFTTVDHRTRSCLMTRPKSCGVVPQAPTQAPGSAGELRAFASRARSHGSAATRSPSLFAPARVSQPRIDLEPRIA